MNNAMVQAARRCLHAGLPAFSLPEDGLIISRINDIANHFFPDGQHQPFAMEVWIPDEAEALRGREPADLVEHLARGLGARDVRVDARGEGEQDALRAHAGLEPEVPRGADHDGHAGHEVHGAGLGHREAAGPDEQEEVAELLDELVINCTRRHDPALAALAPQERVGDEDAVDEVVPEVACVEIKILRRVRAESSRRPPRHRRDACSIA